MKKYALLRLENNSNKVIDETFAKHDTEAAANFMVKNPNLNLDVRGYGRTNYGVTFCVAEYFNQ